MAVKLLFDQNLPPRLAAAMADRFPGSAHVCQRRLDRASDDHLWEFARREGFVIVTRDTDFADRPALRGTPPKVVLLRVRNCSSGEFEALLMRHAEAISALAEDEGCSVLIIR